MNGLVMIRKSLLYSLGHDLQVLLVTLKQILHLKVDCLDFGPVQDRDSLPYRL